MKLSLWSNRDRVVMRSLVVVEETCIISQKRLLQSSISQLLEYTSWKCSLKGDCIRSSLIECKSFSNRKININPKYRVLMFLPCIVQVLCSTWYREVNIFRIFVIFVPRINRQEEYCLSSAQILTSRYQSIVDNRMKIECTSYVVDEMEYSTPNHYIVP